MLDFHMLCYISILEEILTARHQESLPVTSTLCLETLARIRNIWDERVPQYNVVGVQLQTETLFCREHKPTRTVQPYVSCLLMCGQLKLWRG